MSGMTKGGRDYYQPGTWNLMCAYCGRKRKGTEVVQDDEFARGLWCCPEHRDLRHPQEFARGIKEDMTVSKVQPPVIKFVSLPADFPLLISPKIVLLLTGVIDIITETTNDVLLTESGNDITTETAFSSFVYAVLPPWIAPVFSGDPGIIYAVSYQWSWASGGAGITIDSPTALLTELQAINSGLSGVLQLTVVDSLGQTSTATAQVSD